MEDWNITQMTPFDCRITTQSLQITKLLIPYLPPQTQRIMAIYVKFVEFQNTLASFRSFRQTAHSTQDIIQELRPYMPSSACESIDNLMNMMSMMEMFQSFQEASGADGDFDPMSMMQGMFTPEQQSMFEMYNTMFSGETESENNHNSSEVQLINVNSEMKKF